MKNLLPLLIVLFIFSWNKPAHAVYQENIPKKVVQPDGSLVHCFVSGDEFFNYLHDAGGYTIIQGDDGFYYYATRSADGKKIVPTNYRAGKHDPELLDIEKRLVVKPEQYQKFVDEFNSYINRNVKAPVTGQMNNLVVYIRFSDENEFATPRSEFDTSFNLETGPSLRHYFNEVSYEQLEIVSHHFPEAAMDTNLSYQDSHPRGYYQPYNETTNPIGYDPSVALGDAFDQDGRTYRQHTLLASAIAFIEQQVPTSLLIDADFDGNVDNVSFIISGEPGEWNTLLWAHRWSLWSQVVNIGQKRVYDFTFQPEAQAGIRTICHEMFHTLGAPDLYHYSYDGMNPVGPWDLMHSGFVHMGAHMKHKYSNGQWLQDIPVISQPGTYTLEPLYSNQNHAYKILSPNSSAEYFIVEYRKRQGHYETNIPGEGLIIYRINSYYSGNAQGPPDEVYVFRPGGNVDNDGNVYDAFFSLEAGRTEFNDSTDPGGFLENGNPAGLMIGNISSAGPTITFDIISEDPGINPPQNLIADVTADFDIQLLWDAPSTDQATETPQLSGFLIFRNEEPLDTINDPDAVSYLDVGPVAGEYEYFVKAIYANPETLSAETNTAGIEMPGYFLFPGGNQFEFNWQAGDLELELTSNMTQWEASSSEGWLQVDAENDLTHQTIKLIYSANNAPSSRAAQVSLSSTHLEADSVIYVNQLGHPTLVEDLNDPLFELYPNPVDNGNITLRFYKPLLKGFIKVFSSSGTCIIDMEVHGEEILTFDTADFGKGVYLMIISDGKDKYQKKVVVL